MTGAPLTQLMTVPNMQRPVQHRVTGTQLRTETESLRTHWGTREARNRDSV
jgi:hypothetical protein